MTLLPGLPLLRSSGLHVTMVRRGYVDSWLLMPPSFRGPLHQTPGHLNQAEGPSLWRNTRISLQRWCRAFLDSSPTWPSANPCGPTRSGPGMTPARREGAPYLSLRSVWLHQLHHLSLLYQDDLGVPEPGDVQGLPRNESTHTRGATLQPLKGEGAEGEPLWAHACPD